MLNFDTSIENFGGKTKLITMNYNRLEGYLSVIEYPSTRLIYGFDKLNSDKRKNKILFKQVSSDLSLFERVIRDNCYELVEYMLENGASANLKCSMKIKDENFIREMPNFAACGYADLDTFKMLVEKGGNYEPAEIAWIKMEHLGNLLLNKEKNITKNLTADRYDFFIEKEREFVDYIFQTHNLNFFSTTQSGKNLRTMYLFFKSRGINLQINEKSDEMTLSFG